MHPAPGARCSSLQHSHPLAAPGKCKTHRQLGRAGCCLWERCWQMLPAQACREPGATTMGWAGLGGLSTLGQLVVFSRCRGETLCLARVLQGVWVLGLVSAGRWGAAPLPGSWHSEGAGLLACRVGGRKAGSSHSSCHSLKPSKAGITGIIL